MPRFLLLLIIAMSLKYCNTQTRQRCSKCPPGYGAEKKCTNTQDTFCVPCKTGTFSKTYSRNQPCQKCSEKCTSRHFIHKQCTKTRDVICARCDVYDGDITEDFKRSCKKEAETSFLSFSTLWYMLGYTDDEDSDEATSTKLAEVSRRSTFSYPVSQSPPDQNTFNNNTDFLNQSNTTVDTNGTGGDGFLLDERNDVMISFEGNATGSNSSNINLFQNITNSLDDPNAQIDPEDKDDQNDDAQNYGVVAGALVAAVVFFSLGACSNRFKHIKKLCGKKENENSPRKPHKSDFFLHRSRRTEYETDKHMQANGFLPRQSVTGHSLRASADPAVPGPSVVDTPQVPGSSIDSIESTSDVSGSSHERMNNNHFKRNNIKDSRELLRSSIKSKSSEGTKGGNNGNQDFTANGDFRESFRPSVIETDILDYRESRVNPDTNTKDDMQNTSNTPQRVEGVDESDYRA
ncbi:uncharacterized protein LOC106167231 [Lingula anatina]|uniref:Uncharacterized protein LOC106167231 n=1 Tax=Lingula anatina TaxID=7574 RepID=A0A1S3ITZ4_LINAN|nr:uncharacterized protein LOC106167231 [Lingula anatina]|eukprot:XP_013401406.1 uncharacterized protein LOC106167231 [Lingula anatina]